MDPLIPIFFALIFSIFFTGIEVAFAASNKLKIEVDKSKNIFSARLLSRFIKNRAHFVSILWLGNIVSIIVYGIYIDLFLRAPLRQFVSIEYLSDSFIIALEIFIASIIYIVFAELIPRVIFRSNPNKLLMVFAIPAYIIYSLLYPVIVFFISLSELILRIFGIKITSQDYSFNTVDLDKFISESSIPMLEEDEDFQEIQMFQNARDLSKIKLRDCMVPRNAIVAISKEESIENLTSLIIESGHSKILVYEQSIDNVIGYSHSYDMFNKPPTIAEIIKPVIIVPETMAADKILNMFIKERKSVALVVDEFGGTAGMLTIEDIIEEIFGEIDDEYDQEEAEDKQINENEYLVSGRLDIYYLNEKYNFELPESDDYKTLAGFIIHVHKSIPAEGDEIFYERILFKITEASDSRIEQVLIHVNNSI